MNKSDWAGPSFKAVLIGLAITTGGALRVAAEPATAPHAAHVGVADAVARTSRP